jgi:hypothetical protein
MRKSLWIVLALLVVGGAPVAWADSFTPTFTNESGGGIPLTPTAPDVTFPSPTLTIAYDEFTFAFTLPSVDLPTDIYIWFANGICPAPSPGCQTLLLSTFSIFDMNTGTLAGSGDLASFAVVPSNGFLNFTSISVIALALIAVGLGALLVMREHMGRSRPSAV